MGLSMDEEQSAVASSRCPERAPAHVSVKVLAPGIVLLLLQFLLVLAIYLPAIRGGGQWQPASGRAGITVRALLPAVRAGDRLGTVDVLGVREDVVAPVDGVVGLSLTEAGEAVEYGQDLVRIEQPDRAPEAEAGRPAAAPAGVAGIL